MTVVPGTRVWVRVFDEWSPVEVLALAAQRHTRGREREFWRVKLLRPEQFPGRHLEGFFPLYEPHEMLGKQPDSALTAVPAPKDREQT